MHMLRVYGHSHWRRSPREVSAAHASCIRLQTLTAISPSSIQIAARARRPGCINQYHQVHRGVCLDENEKRLAHDQNETDVTVVARLRPWIIYKPRRFQYLIRYWKCRHRDGTLMVQRRTKAGYLCQVGSILVVCQSLLLLTHNPVRAKRSEGRNASTKCARERDKGTRKQQRLTERERGAFGGKG